MKKNLLSFIVIGLLTISSVFAQNKTITGKVTSADDGLPIPSVSVKVTGSANAVQTNVNGTYSISVPANATSLVFSYVGMDAKTETIGSRSIINVVLTSSNDLNEVVITGYGSGRKVGTIVGSVATVSAKVVENKPVANAFDALQGKVAGLQVFTSSGEPSATSSLRLHGVGSLGASNTPLYLLDGIQVDPNTIVSLNPNDIETISILKDASSTSIYGARAANGVLYITTKRGQSGQSNITVQQQYSESTTANPDFYRSVMNTAELSAFQVKQGIRTQAATDALLAQYPNDFLWYDYYVKQNRPTYQTDLTISGGAGKTTYYISGSYYKGEGLLYRSGFERYTFRSNLNTTLNEYLQIGLNLAGGTDDRQLNGWTLNDTNGGLAYLAQPWFSPYKADGSEYVGEQIPGWARYAPNYLADKNPDTRNNLQFNPSAYITFTPIKNLTLKSQGGMDGSIIRRTFGRLPSYAAFPGAGTLNEEYTRTITKTLTNTLEYKHSIGQNNFTALAGQEYVDGVDQRFNAVTQGLTNDNLYLLGNGTATNRGVGSSKTEYAFKSLFGRLEYNLKDRYYIDGSIRQDKSSRFGANKQSATFWSVGGMWRMKQESFLKDISWLDDATLRVSTGTSGNSAIGNYESLATASATGNYNGLSGVATNASGNPELGWERQQKTTVGIKTSFFNKVRLDVEYYFRETSSQLINVPQAFTTGYANIRTNVGALQNQGVDITLDFDVYNNTARKAFVTPYVNANFNRNKITELFQGKNYYINPGTGVFWAIGEPVSYSYPIWKGVNPANGAPQWYVPNTGDGIITPRRDDNAVTSSFSALEQNTGIERYPWLNGGFGFRSGFEGLYLDVDFSFSQGKYMINNDRYFFENPTSFSGFNQSKTVQDYWTTPGQVSTFPALTQQFTQFDTRLIEDASFLRLKSLQLGWNLPQSILKSTKVVKGARLFFIGRNLLTFTDYTGPDPEADTNVSLGVNANTKQVGFGLQVKF
ncbi:MAG: SusC/RagA family TonB-linked outer membrane protein [Bacteroidota bacterium]